MSSYSVGLDFGSEDYSCWVITRGLRWYDKLLRKLHLSKAKWEYKIIAQYYADPTPKETKQK